ncbi:MAG: amino acid adenylation domain-containing protein [Cyanothece sp. SIO1E1]|nr:amino acid adenylation domain-containing protein [Cyanothece sp. SIO1E1]
MLQKISSGDWQRQLANDLPFLDLPTDRPRTTTSIYQRATYVFNFSKEFTESIKALAEAADVSLSTVLLAAFKVLLHRLANQNDILLVAQIAQQRQPETNKERVIKWRKQVDSPDPIANHHPPADPLVLQTYFSCNPTFVELLNQVHQTLKDAVEHQDYALQQLMIEKRQQDRNSTSRSQVMFVWQPLQMSTPANTDLPTETHSSIDSEGLSLEFSIPEFFALTLIMAAKSGPLAATLAYDQALFDEATIARIAGHFQTLLAGIVRHPQTPVAHLPLLTAHDRHQLLVAWNQTQRDYPQDQGFHQLFEAQAAWTPDAIAVTSALAQVTYRELNQRANQLAHYLRDRGVGPEVLVGICVERSIEMMVGLLGVLKAGGAYVPLDPAYPYERLTSVLADSQVQILLSQEHLIEQLAPKITTLGPTHINALISLDSDWQAIATHSSENPINQTQPDNLAYVIYTSGSTGQPKGVMVAHQGLCNLATAHIEYFNVQPTSRVLQFASFSFDASIWEIAIALSAGARLCLGTAESLQAGPNLTRLLQHQEITHTLLPPSVLATLPSQQLPKLKTVIVGGEACPPDLIKQWSVGRRFFNAYGPTESTVCATVAELTTSDSSALIGRPIANTQIYILDTQLQPVPIGVPGELHISSVGLARGYLNQPDLTAQKFIANPFGPQGGRGSRGGGEAGEARGAGDAGSVSTIPRLYKTGDLARYQPDGSIEFLGRIDQQVKIRGFRIELGEIESVLSQHPAVQQSVVIVHTDQLGEKQLIAYVVAKRNITSERYTIPTAKALRQFLQQRLPNHMIPAAFVKLPVFPLTPNAKVDRKALPVPDLTQLARTHDFVAPRNLIEAKLALIWANVLRQRRVGINDNFLDLGGHSLRAAEITVRIREKLQVEISASSLFEFPTIAELAQYIKDLQAENAQNSADQHSVSIPIAARDQAIPLSFGQEQLWFLAHLYQDSPVYNESCVLHFHTTINADVLEKSLIELIRRHEILRTTFAVVGGKPTQVIHSHPRFTLKQIDLRQLSTNNRETEALCLATEELRRPFDINKDQLLRAALIQFTATEYKLFLVVHHIVLDGSSIANILVPELEALYTASLTGGPTLLSPLTWQYADFAVWQRQWLQAENLSPQLAYWQQQLAHLPALQLPSDRPLTPQTTFQGVLQRFSVSKGLTEQLKTLSRQADATLFMTLTAVVKTLLYRYSNQEDIAVGTISARRNRPELENMIGYFNNTLVLRTDLAGNPSFRELLMRVREVALAAYAHQDVPFSTLLQTLQPERLANQTPLFRVMVAPTHATSERDAHWQFSYKEVHSGTAKFDLTFSLDETPTGIIGSIEYRSDLFEATRITRMIGHLQTLLAGVVANPDQQLANLLLLTPAERHQLLVEWNQTDADYPQAYCIHQLFEAQVAQTPEAIALIFGDAQLTYQAVNHRANQLAYYLQSLRVGPNVRVGICLNRSLEMVIGLLGILKAGGAYVPIDPTYPQERIAYMLDNANVSVLLTQQLLVASLPELDAPIVCLDSDWQAIATHTKASGPSDAYKNPPNQATSSNLAYVIYTSGSTGKPKGVMVRHQSVVNVIDWVNKEFRVGWGDRLLFTTSLSFDLSVYDIFGLLAAGGSIYITSEAEQQDPKILLQLLYSQAITFWDSAPAACQRLVPFLPISNPIEHHLRLVFFSGDWIPLTLPDTVKHAFPGTQVVSLGGATEATIWSNYYVIDEVQPDWASIPYGKPIQNAHYYILDQHLNPCPIGITGSLYISGICLASGYANDPEKTAKQFIPNPFWHQFPSAQDTAGNVSTIPLLYKTGDIARYLPDGNIEFLGRIDNQVKIRGFRIELGEIEAVLNTHPQVQQALVVARKDTPGNKQLVAYLVSSQLAPSQDELRHFLKQELPDYMVPSAFVSLAALPLTPNGKVDRRALPAPDVANFTSEASFVAPRDSLELQLAQLWADVLGVAPIGVRDSFFDLGGHSLLAVNLMTQIEQQFGQQLSLSALFRSATIEQLALLLRQGTHTQSWSPLVAIQPKGSKLPFFCIPGVGGNVVYLHELASHLGVDQPFYGLQAWGLDGISAPFTCIESMAAYYIEAIKTVQTQGPYQLGGHSFGAAVAFEMAQQLQHQDGQVMLLALLDLPVLRADNTLTQLDWDHGQWISVVAHVLEMLSGRDLGVSDATLHPLEPDEQLNYLKQQLELANLLPPNSSIERVRGIVETTKASELALLNYLPPAGYQGQITLFRTREAYYDGLGIFGDLPDDLAWGWGQLSTQPVDVQIVLGNHTTMLSSPHVQVLAEKLKTYLCGDAIAPFDREID